MTNTRTVSKKPILTITIAVTVLALIGTAWALYKGNEDAIRYQIYLANPMPVTAPPISEELSSETREGCLALGMSTEEIEADQDACLAAYWTPERLERSTRIYLDWYAAHGAVEPWCQEPTPDGGCIEDLAASGELDPTRPPLPTHDDPWWAEQAVLDPGRVTAKTDGAP